MPEESSNRVSVCLEARSPVSQQGAKTGQTTLSSIFVYENAGSHHKTIFSNGHVMIQDIVIITSDQNLTGRTSKDLVNIAV